ncbi:hypothetical protein [Xanthocytophaga flava]|uniref:hypothetical protein n=1 Tax=Xanthocytophaga flava TaxID=3048013 RepID=UPI0028D677B8|nr:hypothetical protein [Xanthocytophaga flavus]MDJ1466968.1 hypothetical protein [Xanthocytophaga flavus]
MDYKQKFDEIKTLKPRKRGFEFEKLILKICEDQNILLTNSYKTADNEQQIDGAIEVHSRIFLIEAKWEKTATLAASKLFSFLGKVNSKIEGTLGVFISYNTLNDNIISSVRNGLRQTCIVIHGEDNIFDLIEKKVAINDFIWYTFQQASTMNRCYSNTSEYQSLPRKNGKTQNSGWQTIVSCLLDQTITVQFSIILQQSAPSIKLSKNTLNIFNVAQTDYLKQQKYDILVNFCLDNETDYFISQLVDKLKSRHWKDYTKFSFLEKIKNHKSTIINKIAKTDKIEITKIALIHLKENLGSYDEENTASMLINFLFETYTNKGLLRLAQDYLIIYCDKGRSNKFLQKQIANKIFKKLEREKVDIWNSIKITIINQLELRKREEYLYPSWIFSGNDQKLNTISFVKAKFKLILDELAIDENILSEEYDKILISPKVITN